MHISTKDVPDYVDYVKENAEHVLNGTEFHISPPIQTRNRYN